MSPAAGVRGIVRPLLPRKARPRRILRGPLRGCHLVASWYDYPAGLLGYTEGPLLRWLASVVRSGDTWLDVGAHYGYTALALARLVGSSGRVFAFEPVEGTVECLCETRELNGLSQLDVVPVGLAASEAGTCIEVSFVRGMAQPQPFPGCGRGTIPLAALDQLWSRLARGRAGVEGIKVDVQGMELSALRGMRALLGEQRPLLAIEFHGGVDRDAVLRLLRSCGYRLPGRALAPVRGEAQPLYLDDRTYVFSVREGEGAC